MPLVLVVDAVHFWTLEEVAHPVRRFHVRVIEKLSCCAAEGEYCAAAQIKSQEGIDKQTADDRIGNHLNRVFIERGDHFNPLRAVMDLVETQPQKVDAMTPPMPPVKDERTDEVRQTAARER